MNSKLFWASMCLLTMIVGMIFLSWQNTQLQIQLDDGFWEAYNTGWSEGFDDGVNRGLQMAEHDATYGFIEEKCYLGELEGSFCEYLGE